VVIRQAADVIRPIVPTPRHATVYLQDMVCVCRQRLTKAWARSARGRNAAMADTVGEGRVKNKTEPLNLSARTTMQRRKATEALGCHYSLMPANNALPRGRRPQSGFAPQLRQT